MTTHDLATVILLARRALGQAASTMRPAEAIGLWSSIGAVEEELARRERERRAGEPPTDRIAKPAASPAAGKA